jgi:5'-phosphate synthase pdxT subunit
MVEATSLGVLSLQGDFAEHQATLSRLGVASVQIRSAEQLDTISALIIPGGESTTMLKLLDRFELRDRLTKKIEDGLPVFGTCAGGIILSKRVSDGEAPIPILDITVKRNAYGPQVESFETEIEVSGVGSVRGVFIRAPVIEEVGSEVQVLGEWAGDPVIVRENNILFSTFHPELTEETRLHQYFLEEFVRAS